MKNILKRITLIAASLVAAISIAFVFAAPVSAQANPAQKAVCEGVNQAGGTCASNGAQLSKVIKLVLEILSTVAGIAAVIMIVIGGLKYVTSGGDSSKVSSAKSAIIYALVGLVVVAMAQFIVRFVLNRSINGKGSTVFLEQVIRTIS